MSSERQQKCFITTSESKTNWGVVMAYMENRLERSQIIVTLSRAWYSLVFSKCQSQEMSKTSLPVKPSQLRK